MITKLSKQHFVRDDGVHFHTGRKCILKDSRTAKFENFIETSNLPPLIAATNWSTNIPAGSFPMDLNDSIGDCTCAGLAHLATNTSFNVGNIVIPTDAEVLAMYEMSGYKPNQPNTDNGWTLLDAAKYMANKGLSGVGALAFLDVDQTNINHVQYTVQLFGGANTGVMLPQSAMDDFGKKVWDNTTDKNYVGGHDLPIVDFNTTGPIYVTWGAKQQATWDWFLTYTDEAMAILFNIWMLKMGVAPSGFDYQALMNYLQLVKA